MVISKSRCYLSHLLGVQVLEDLPQTASESRRDFVFSWLESTSTLDANVDLKTAIPVTCLGSYEVLCHSADFLQIDRNGRMFTGIVRETGEIIEKRASDQGMTFRFRSGSLHPSLGLGHSISVDGVCLTVTQKGDDWVEVDATPETLRRSNLGRREVGEQLNLEPSLQLSDFLGGHLVQGHVDATGTVVSIQPEGNSVIFRIGVPDVVRKYCVFKGSITLNGISLTISELGDDFVEVTIIPHTLDVTNMSELKVGDIVNLEADVISKYVESHVQRSLGADSDADG